MKEDYKNVIGIDFQGWPIFKRNLREILKNLGAEYITMEDGKSYLAFEDTDEHLDAFPKVLEDDGMGYGVNERWIFEASPNVYLDKEIGESVFNIFASETRPKEVEKFQKELEEFEINMKVRGEKGE